MSEEIEGKALETEKDNEPVIAEEVKPKKSGNKIYLILLLLFIAIFFRCILLRSSTNGHA